MDPAQNETARNENQGNELKLKLTRENIKDSKYSWIACLCAVVDQIFVCGLLQIFGVYFVEFVKDFNSSQSQAAWLGSLAYGIMKLFGPFTGYFVVRFSNRAAMFLGCLICALSLLISSFIETITVLFKTFSLMYGFGASLVINCAMILANEYFDKHLGLATGLVCAGSSIGTLVLAPTSQLMINDFGWRISFRVLAGVFVCVSVLNIFIRPVPKPQKVSQTDSTTSNLKEIHILKNKVFLLWTLATSLAMFGYYIPFVHLVAYGIDVGIPAVQASYLIMALGGATTIGRLTSGRIIQYGYLNILHLNQFCMIGTGSMYMILPMIKSFGGLLTFVIVLGLFDGCYVVLLPLLTCSLVGMNNVILAWGMLVCISSVTFTSGPPAAGALHDLNGNYDAAFQVAGIPVICGALVLFFIPWAQRQSRQSKTLEIVCSDSIVDGKRTPLHSFDSISQDASDATIDMNMLRKRGVMLPPGDLGVSSVSGYLESHFQNTPEQNVSTSLGDHREKSQHSVALKSESCPVPLNLMCGPDGMPISIPSRIMNPHSSGSTITRISVTSSKAPSTGSRSITEENRSTTSRVNAGTNTDSVSKKSPGATADSNDSAPSDWSTRNNTGTSAVGENSLMPGGVSFSPSEPFVSVSLLSNPKNHLAATPSAISSTTRDGEDVDMFRHIFKEDKSETSM